MPPTVADTPNITRVDRSFALYALAMKAAVDVLIDQDGKTAEAVAKEFQTWETNYNLKSMSQAEIQEIFETLLAEVGDSLEHTSLL